MMARHWKVVVFQDKQDLTRLTSKAKAQMASGQGSHWFIESPTFHV